MTAKHATDLALAELSQALRDEVQHKIDVRAEDGDTRTIADALREIAEDIDDHDPDIKGSAGYRYSAAVRREVKRLLVKLGVLSPITDEEARERCRNGYNVTMRSFERIDGVRHEFVSWDSLPWDE